MPALAVAREDEMRDPVSRPADRAEQSLIAVLQAEERQVVVRGTTAGRVNLRRLAGREVRIVRREIIRRGIAALRPMKNGMVLHGYRPREWLEVLDNRRVLLPLVGEVEHPIDRGITGERAHIGDQLQRSGRVGEGVAVRFAAFARQRLVRARPAGKEVG